MPTLHHLASQVQNFVEARDWSVFHTPKNLATCLSVEASELLELYQWQLSGPDADRPGAGPPPQHRIEEEVGDVLISLLNFCHATNIDPIDAALRKLEKVKLKYPVETSKGSAKRPS